MKPQSAASISARRPSRMRAGYSVGRAFQRPFLFALIAGSFAASIASAQSAALPSQAKRRIFATASESLKAGEITARQHAEVVRWTRAEPCKGVRVAIPASRRQAIARAVSQDQGYPNAQVLGYFEARGWFIVFTDASPGDAQYLVYDSDPAGRAKPRTSWSGAASMFETTDIRNWLRTAAPGIPRRLADCFAWHVTLGL